MGNDQQSLEAEHIAAYLAAHPDFFSQHPDCLERVELAIAPEGTVSLVQRQTDLLKAKNQQLQEQLELLIETARQNTQLQARVHTLCLKLMDAHDLNDLLPGLIADLKQEFQADEVSLTLFYGEHQHQLPADLECLYQMHIDDERLKAFDKVLEKHEPVCGRLTNAQKSILFEQTHDQVASIACLPIGHAPCGGLLAIASYDQDRFHSNMATDYLAFLAEVLMRLLRLHYQQ